MRDREGLIGRAVKAGVCGGGSIGDDAVDAALRELCDALANIGHPARRGGGGGGDYKGGGDDERAAIAAAAARLSGDARDAAAFLVGGDGDGGGMGGLVVPRDLGVIPFEALRTLAEAAPKPRI